MAAADAVTSAECPTTGDAKRHFDFSVSDFATIVTTTAYVDKSLMIKDVYNASSRIMITAPPRFGKSTNLNMVKRFFEIEVDACGIAKPVHTTNNYKLFKDYNLEICKDIDFFNEHFGKYPVVHIGFKPLSRVDESAKILDAFKMIVKNSLNEHNYILQHSLKKQVFSGLYSFDENDFRKYVSGGKTKDTDEVNLANSFNHLSTILKVFFGKKVFVLVDSYDAFLESPLFENSTDRKRIMSFVESSIGQLLNNINCVDRVLITGVLPVILEGFLCSENSIEHYHFLDSHPFIKYYGLTSAEVDMILSKIIEQDERSDVECKINKYYCDYGSCNRDISVYNVLSVLQYICKRRVQSYWCERRYINKFKKCFKIEPIRQKLEVLLGGNELELDLSQPLLITDILKVNNMIRSGKAEHLSIEVELFLALLYHLGYLSVSSEVGRGVVCVNIWSIETRYELAKAIFDENMELYNGPYVNDILSDLDALQPVATDQHKIFEKFIRNVSYWYKSNNFQFTHIHECLFMNLTIRAEYRDVMWRKLGPDGPNVVLLNNRHKVAICLTCDGVQSAESIHQKVTDYNNGMAIFDMLRHFCGEVIIAVGYNCRIAYSYSFKTGGNLLEVRTLP